MLYMFTILLMLFIAWVRWLWSWWVRFINKIGIMLWK